MLETCLNLCSAMCDIGMALLSISRARQSFQTVNSESEAALGQMAASLLNILQAAPPRLTPMLASSHHAQTVAVSTCKAYVSSTCISSFEEGLCIGHGSGYIGAQLVSGICQHCAGHVGSRRALLHLCPPHSCNLHVECSCLVPHACHVWCRGALLQQLPPSQPAT